jgi:hypothetical protein
MSWARALIGPLADHPQFLFAPTLRPDRQHRRRYRPTSTSRSRRVWPPSCGTRSWTPGSSSPKTWAQRRHPWCSRRWSAKPEGALAAFELPVTVNPQPAPRLTVERAAERRGLLGLPFLFFLDAGHDRGSPLYHRHDGHYGLLTPQASLVMSLCPQERGRVVAASCCGGRAPVV